MAHPSHALDLIEGLEAAAYLTKPFSTKPFSARELVGRVGAHLEMAIAGMA
jgi:DNA-binding response OmpR family regulator